MGRTSRAVGAGVVLALSLAGCSSSPGAPPSGAAAPPKPTGAVVASSSVPALASATAASDRPGLDPDHTWAVIVGVLSFQDAKIASFSDRHRKDRELADVLVARGVPKERVTVLLDAEATHDRVFEALEKAAKAAPKGSTFVFYYAGHGDKSDSGEVSFVAYDASTKPETALSLSKVERILADDLKSDRVVLLADCCFSGGLAAVAASLEKGGKRAVSLTSAEASNTSTENWTFTQTLIDDLGGDPLADRDGDGLVTLSEVALEERDAMQFRERQRSGASIGDDMGSFVLARRQGASIDRGARPSVGSYVEVERKERGSAVGRVMAATTSALSVELYDYSDKERIEVPTTLTHPIRFTRYDVGAKLRVYWGHKTWDARVTRTDGDFAFITYPGWPSFWDEWILSDRVASEGTSQKGEPPKGELVKGDAAFVEWRGKWWEGHVLDVQGGRYLVHYDGYDASWDEWVPRVRAKKR